ncbi:MAG: hypothetical protein JHC61_12490 [Burkholderiaceae bacterium]|nr:hypothetical protein [Burkholderiaceae bacterium]
MTNTLLEYSCTLPAAVGLNGVLIMDYPSEKCADFAAQLNAVEDVRKSLSDPCGSGKAGKSAKHGKK